MKKLRIGVIYGGRSGEHEVSLASAAAVFKNLDPQRYDAVPILHGPYGEDGTVQGLLELANLPYVGAGVLASSVGMDKAAMKLVFAAKGLPICDYEVVLKRDWQRDPHTVLTTIVNRLGFPVFVKPANLGSSVGISKAKHTAELRTAINLAAEFDRKIVIEAAVPAAR